MKAGMGRVSRRSVLRGTGAAAGLAAGSGAIRGFPTIWAQNIKDVVLHHSGPPVTAIPAHRRAGDQGPRLHRAHADGRRTPTCSTASCRSPARSTAPTSASSSCATWSAATSCRRSRSRKVKDWDKTIPLFTKGDLSRRPRGARSRASRPTRWSMPPVRTARSSPARAHRLADRRADRHQRRHARHPARPGRAGRSRAGPTWSAPSSRARRRCRTSRPSASSTSRWRWRRAATSSTATRAT